MKENLKTFVWSALAITAGILIYKGIDAGFKKVMGTMKPSSVASTTPPAGK